jgi:molybdenum cofactor biosynthesis enzyme MoaA
VQIERISIELTNACQKACWFCYNSSRADGATSWTVDELLDFITSCAAASVRAVSFGGGEPLQFVGWQALLIELQGLLFRSLTTNGLPLRQTRSFDALVAAAPDKVHISIHFPDRREEVDRVIEQVTALAAAGIRSGVNLLVSRSNLPACEATARRLRDHGIDNDRIVYLPMRMADTPSPAEVARVAGGPFQSMTCLAACGRSSRFCSIGWNKTVAWCSYTRSRRELKSLTYDGVVDSLTDLELEYCGNDSATNKTLALV